MPKTKQKGKKAQKMKLVSQNKRTESQQRKQAFAGYSYLGLKETLGLESK